jgi:hypothetical protein
MARLPWWKRQRHNKKPPTLVKRLAASVRDLCWDRRGMRCSYTRKSVSDSLQEAARFNLAGLQSSSERGFHLTGKPWPMLPLLGMIGNSRFWAKTRE